MTAGGNGNLNLWRHESADKSNKVGLLYVMNNERIRWRRNRKKTSFMKRSKVRKRRFPFSMCLSHRSSSWGLQAYPTSQYVNSRGIRIKLAWASPPPSIKSPESSLWHAWRNPKREQRGFWRYLTLVYFWNARQGQNSVLVRRDIFDAILCYFYESVHCWLHSFVFRFFSKSAMPLGRRLVCIYRRP